MYILGYMQSGDAMPLKSNYGYWVMWNTIPRLCSSLLSDINIGAQNDLQIKSYVNVGGSMKLGSKWPFDLCVKLTDLAVGLPSGETSVC